MRLGVRATQAPDARNTMPADRRRTVWRVLVHIRRKLEPSGCGGQDDYWRRVVNVR
jgi:hypothetical protein